MTIEQKPDFSGLAQKTYDRMLSRVEAAVTAAGSSSWEGLQQEVDKAVAFEVALEELTREEIDLLATYVKRDVAHMLNFVSETGDSVGDWLQLDIALVEQQLFDTLLSIADKTQLDTLELNQKISHGPDEYMAGEVATAGQLRCLACGERLSLTGTTHLQPCHHCQSHYFERVTGGRQK